jgi:hypothetical protein
VNPIIDILSSVTYNGSRLQVLRKGDKQLQLVVAYYRYSNMADELRELATDAIARTASGESPQKRTKLKSYDQFCAQVFNPNGESGIAKTPLPKIAKAMATGNKAAPYFSELCSPIPKRQGIEISRLCEIQHANGKKLQEDVYKNNIKATLYNQAMKEYEDLEPHFTALIGKGLTMDDDDNNETVGRIAYAATSNVDFRQPDAVNAAVTKVYAWLMQPQSKLRALTALLSGGGLFYVASVHEKCHRAYIQHGTSPEIVSEATYANWARARLCNPNFAAENPINNDLDGLR